MFGRILVPVDGSDCAAAAVGYAADLAGRYDATVHVLSVADSRRVSDEEALAEAESRAAETVESTRAELEADGLATEESVRTGVPHEEILAAVDEAGVDLVVMGTHGRTGVERYFLGSVAERVVRLANVPVLTVRQGGKDGGDGDAAATYPFKNVLIPTDGSGGAANAVAPAVDIARTYGARVHALSVVDPMAMGVDVRSEAIADALEEAARAAVEDVESLATEAGIASVQTAVEYGRPYRQIRAYVEDNDVDLVVMGTRGRTGIERYLLGSVAERVLRTSPAPVMTVRSASGEESTG